MRLQTLCSTTIALGLLVAPIASHQALAVSRAMQICTAKWNEHLRTLPAPPPPGSNAKSKFINDCLSHTSSTTTSTTSHTITRTTTGPAVTVDPPDPEKHDVPATGH